MLSRTQSHPLGAIPAIPGPLRSGLCAIYRDLDAALVELGATCRACGQCCHLGKWGHQMWLTNIELSLLVTEAALRRPRQKGVCPYLESNGSCAARPARALGCRVFHCEIRKNVMEDLYEQYFNRIADMAAAHRVELRYTELLDSLETLSDLRPRAARGDIP